MKKLARQIVAAILAWQVRRLQKKNNFKVVAVAGSIGKTSTKFAIANVLSAGLRVRYQEGNYNDLVTVPLIYFGRPEPSLFNPLAWLSVFIKNEIQLFKPCPYDVVVVEVGTDAPGQIIQFKKFLKAEIAVVTAITPEHMEFFEDLNAVAVEELSISQMASLTLLNKDYDHATQTDGALTYAINQPADFQMSNIQFSKSGCDFDVLAGGKKIFKAEHEAFAEPQLYAILAAVAVAYKLGLDSQTIQQGLSNIQPVAGRMRRLPGINRSTIIDDTYNASPEAVSAALKTLYRLPASQKIAILGNMNELGKFSKAAHEEAGQFCDPKQLDLVVTIGPDANKYLAPAAEANGCTVKVFDDPYSAGEFVKSQVKKGALILAKGSQNKVFAEEAIKILLTNPEDASKLVRQSKYWLEVKRKNFK
ncbi:MAG TPA: UDP-N-acetylmuramoyl-tripeptide--D-alanyl-D-alanine ligase [Candidatus Saccharimonadales bacterium]|nr:UDP-N-acetylmuramoyl-tripeptide--D-alanyl-D-alanine ligase [Candidatus Saccharimonadales bacterium]